MVQTDDALPIVIVGGGICGLTTAIALSRAGRSVHIMERESSFPAEGAGIQIGPNGLRILREFGLLRSLSSHVVAPQYIDISDGWEGSLIKRLPIQDFSQSRHGAPYWVIHRAALQQMLLLEVGQLDGVEISMGCDVSAVEERGDRVRIHTASGRTEDGAALIAADGLWSSVRAAVFPSEEPEFAGFSAWRTVVPTGAVPSLFRDSNVGLWLAPDSHLVHYPIEGGQQVNIVAIVSDHVQSDSWVSAGDERLLAPRFNKWWPPIRVLINTLGDWQRWSLYDRAPLAKWSVGRIVFAGDAAHPMLPFFAQGGVMAMEDADALARAVRLHGDDFQTAWRLFESERRGRVQRVMMASRRNGKRYHYGSFGRWVRNSYMRLMPPAQLLKKYDWLYGYGHGGGSSIG